MSYKIVLSDDAQKTLSTMPRDVAAFTAAQLEALADAPTLLSRPSYFPFLPNCQISEFDKDSGGKRHFIRVLFQYSQDETSLLIVGISYQAAEDWWGKDG